MCRHAHNCLVQARVTALYRQYAYIHFLQRRQEVILTASRGRHSRRVFLSEGRRGGHRYLFEAANGTLKEKEKSMDKCAIHCLNKAPIKSEHLRLCIRQHNTEQHQGIVRRCFVSGCASFHRAACQLPNAVLSKDLELGSAEISCMNTRDRQLTFS